MVKYQKKVFCWLFAYLSQYNPLEPLPSTAFITLNHPKWNEVLCMIWLRGQAGDLNRSV